MTGKLRFGALVTALAFGMAVVGCGSAPAPVRVGENALVGTWVDNYDAELRFDGAGNWEALAYGNLVWRGTFSAEGGVLTLEGNYVHGNFINEIMESEGLPAVHAPVWFSRDEFTAVILDLVVAYIVEVEGPFEPHEMEEFVAYIDRYSEEFLWEFGFYELIYYLFTSTSGPYSINGNTLTAELWGETSTFTRR